MVTLTPKAVLTEARSLLASGWLQGRYGDGNGHYCIRGAISAASGVMDPTATEFATTARGWWAMRALSKKIDADWAAAREVEKHLPEQHFSIPMFNDHPTTTHADVLAVMDKAISSC